MTAALRGLIGHIPDHPSLVPLVDAGVSDGRVFVVTPFVSGESVDRALATYGPAASSDALPRLRQLADAIDRAWEVGLGHGALTPSHIVVATDCTRILELGVAQALLRAGERVPLSSPYAAPEALGGAPCSPAADQYSLAAITHEWLFGEPPAECGVPAFDLPHLAGFDVAAVTRAFASALAPQPDQRFASCTAFVDALDNATRLDLVRSVATPFDDVTDESRRDVSAAWATGAIGSVSAPGRLTTGTLAATLILGIAIGAGAMWTWLHPRPGPGANIATQEFTDAPVRARVPPEPAPQESPAALAGSAAGGPANVVATVARVATASLLVRSTPAGAMITMNGAARGVTPMPLRDLEFGDHTIVVSRSGYRPVERQVSLTADRRSRAIEVALAPEDPGRASPAPADTAGSLVIDSRPTGATVTIDGRRAGVTPVAVTTLPGRHSVRLERPGYRAWATTIDMQAGARARVAGSLVGGQEEE